MILRVSIITPLVALLVAGAAHGQTVPADGRYIQDWLVAGPFTRRHLLLLQVTGVLGPAGLVPEEGRPVSRLTKDVPGWTHYQAVGSQVNLIDALGQHEDSGALAFTTIQAEAAGEATFYVGSDDQVRIWINDKLVHRHDEARPLWPDEDCFTVDLRAGENRCLVFVAQGRGNWGFTLRAVAGENPGPVPFVWDVADVKGQDRELYTPHWRYLAGDNSDFADPAFDGSSWSRVMPAGIVHGVEGEPVVWFRTRVWCTRALVNLPCRLSATDAGKAEVFLDGNLVCTVDHDSTNEAGLNRSEDLTASVPFMFTAEQQVLAVRLTRHVKLRDEGEIRLQLNMTVADTFERVDEAAFSEFAGDLRSNTSLQFHRLVLLLALTLFLVFHGALLYFYPERKENWMFCVTLGLSLVTLGVLHAQEAAEGTRYSQPLYWLFIAMVSACMLSGLALAHTLWRGDLPKRKLLVWAAMLAGLYLVGWGKNDRMWAFAALPLSTIEYYRLFFLNAWRKTSGAWIFGVGLACFTTAQAVNVANSFLPLPLPSNGFVSYLWAYGFVALLACVSVYIGREFAAATRKLEDLTATLATRVEKYARQLEKKHVAQARLETLRYQLNPHFLYNVLNSVEALSRDDPSHIPSVIQRLCEYLRCSLDATEDGTATLGEELDTVTTYVRVEKVRFEEQLDVSYEVSDAARRQRIPEFLLQPLVENAIKHGMRTSAMPLRIVIRGTCGAERLRIVVKNTGSLSNHDQRRFEQGVGLKNTRARLELLYGDQYRLTMREAERWVSVTVEIPLTGSDPERVQASYPG